MKKALRVALISFACLLAVVLAGTQIFLDSRSARNIIDRFAAENVDGEVSYSRLHLSLLRRFPKLTLSLDSLCLTYPHERFASYAKPLEGRGNERDTLVSVAGVSLSFSPIALINRQIMVTDVRLSDFALFAHQFDTVSNWTLIKFPPVPNDTASVTEERLHVTVKRFSMERPHISFSNLKRGVELSLDLDLLSASAGIRKDVGEFSFDRLELALDSLEVSGRMSRDRFSLIMPRLRVDNDRGHMFDVQLIADANTWTPELGFIDIPLGVDGLIGFDRSCGRSDFEVRDLALRAAHIPMRIDGRASTNPEGLAVEKASLKIEECHLDTLIREYVSHFAPIASQLSTDARLSADISADGMLSDVLVPQTRASAVIDASSVKYIPKDVEGGFALSVSAEITEDRCVTATLERFKAVIPGLDLILDGGADDILGEDPAYRVDAKAHADMETLLPLVPESMNIGNAEGGIDIELSADVNRSELNLYKFRNADVRGRIAGERLHLTMPKDSINAELFRPELNLSSKPEGLNLSVNMDSVYFNMGVKVLARVREMRNVGTITKVMTRHGMAPHISLQSTQGRSFAKISSSRIGLDQTDITIAARKLLNEEERSLRPVRPASGGDSLRVLPSFLSEKDFMRKDVKIPVDSTVSGFLARWMPTANIHVNEGFFASPAMPLRSRLNVMDIKLNERDVILDTIHVSVGTSDLGIRGEVLNWHRLMTGHNLINADLDMRSSRINVNELVAALMKGHSDIGEVRPEDEMDESFVTDTLVNAKIEDTPLRLIVVPANVIASARVRADSVNAADLVGIPVDVTLSMRERTAQISEAEFKTNVGDIDINAFYSTKTKNDITAGVNLELTDMSAAEVIRLIPAVDEIMPALKSFSGKIGCIVSATTQLDTNMNLIMPSLDGVIRVSGKDLEIMDAGKLRRITSLLMFRNKNIGHIDNLDVNAVIHDSKLEVFPFELGVDRYRIALQGMQGFDGSMYYHASILKSPFLIPFGINIYGTYDNWRFGLCRAKFRSDNIPVYTKEFDNVHLNILNSIRNVYSSSIDEIRRFNRNNFASVDISTEELSADEQSEIDNIGLGVELQEQEAELMEEVSEAIEEASMDTEKLLVKYEEELLDKGIRARIERLKRQAELRRARRKS